MAVPEPLYQQIASLIEDAIVEEALGEGQRAPSTNELANFHSINPATARRGVALLAARGVLHKVRGVGMFVSQGARRRVLDRRREEFAGAFLAPVVDEAVRLRLTRAQLHELIDKVAESRGFYGL
ncbi:GntR family transcriptional regulator [Corynebacterium uterequi]|uniref:Putative transcriptional regulator n=1 Tax=Corynebacterium uterequi TaxID=1072256 RepID=A0A0G3HM05_9CORY|nr:GntR family transcriptional regulator [Corynebacterium uterequi]AKK12122.1 putative transcriptional regulator [Corynebacterium uterequi]